MNTTSIRVLAGWLVLVTTQFGVLAGDPIPLESLPPPPAPLKQLMEAGQVVFETGARQTPAPSPVTGDAASALRANVRGSSQPQNFAARTEYRIHFETDSATSWRVQPDQRVVVVSLKLRRIVWQPTHTIWFRDRPGAEDFWSNPLVLHEFDHVRLSTDPRFKATFEQWLRKPMVIRQPWTDGKPIDQQRVDRWAQEALQARFHEALDLIDIRYSELDRQTAHGTMPLPEASPLYPLLRVDRAEGASLSDEEPRR